jgi:CheY-like chemotaxis protein
MNASTLNGVTYRVLIVDDEQDDWTVPMKEALAVEAKSISHAKIEILTALDADEAYRLLAKHHFQVVSLDMRLPERKSEIISVKTGIELARRFPYIGFPKRIIYSISLNEPQNHADFIDFHQVMEIGAERYAKPTGSDYDEDQTGNIVLTVDEWAQLIADSLIFDKLPLRRHPKLKNSPPLTVLGSYLEHGPELMPPFLAAHLQDIANHWETKNSRRSDAGIKLIEATIRLAFVQTAVLLREDGQIIALPSDERISTCLRLLEDWQPHLNQWNWSNYLNKEALSAFREALSIRNGERHSLKVNDLHQVWSALRVPLQYALDVIAYWVRHPLCVDLRYTRDGWSAELLAGNAYPRKRRLLPNRLDFPAEALHGGVWQSVWRIDEDPPVSVSLCWDDWLKPDPASDRHWWLPSHLDHKNRKHWLDIDSGEQSLR